MEIGAELQGVEESLEMMSRFVAAEEKALKDFLEWLLRAMVNYVKENGPWTDRTGNLRNSISCNIEKIESLPADTDPATVKARVMEYENPVLQIEGDNYTGAISANMDYAIWVETTSGYWVLQGAIDAFEPLIEKYFSDFLSVENLDLGHIASVQYARYYGGD